MDITDEHSFNVPTNEIGISALIFEIISQVEVLLGLFQQKQRKHQEDYPVFVFSGFDN